MKEVVSYLTFMFLFIVMAFTSAVNAATINAASCSSSHVQAAVAESVSGDTVIVPVGTCAWDTEVNIPSGKKITLMGQGIGNTTILRKDNATIINLGESGSRITGFTIQEGLVKTQGHNWRIDHCRFEHLCSPTGGTVFCGILPQVMSSTSITTGLIDHNQFHNMRVVVFGGPMMANFAWSRPLGLGTADAVYVEDNSFTYDNCTTIQAMDANYGGSYVFRYNYVEDASIMAHAIQATNGNRAARKWEVYNNLFVRVGQQVGTGLFPGFMRAGTGVWFNNELVGVWNKKYIILDEQRSCLDFSTTVERKCDGNSPWDGNTPGMAGYPCRDQIGRSTDNPYWTNDPPGKFNQALDAAYAWNNWHYPTENDRLNKTNNTPVVMRVKNACTEETAHIVEQRDFYNSESPKPGYIPYTYPHPLSKPLPLGTMPLPPRNLTIQK